MLIRGQLASFFFYFNISISLFISESRTVLKTYFKTREKGKLLGIEICVLNEEFSDTIIVLFFINPIMLYYHVKKYMSINK